MVKIQKIRIKNFRALKEVELQFDQINIFVGKNDAGKSTVLKALNLFLMARLIMAINLILTLIIVRKQKKSARKRKKFQLNSG